MPDELKPQATIDSPEFAALLKRYHCLVSVPAKQKAYAALIDHIDAWGSRIAGEAATDAKRYRHLRGAQWFKAGFAKTEANASAFHYAGELLDSLVDAQIAGSPASGRENA